VIILYSPGRRQRYRAFLCCHESSSHHFARPAPLCGRLVGNQLPGSDRHGPRPPAVIPEFIKKCAANIMSDAKFIDRKNFAVDCVALAVHRNPLQCLSDIGGFDGCAIVLEEFGPKLVGRPYLVPNLVGRTYVKPFQGWPICRLMAFLMPSVVFSGANLLAIKSALTSLKI
jgi:hypothetical protein